jgi:hypothetical protein
MSSLDVLAAFGLRGDTRLAAERAGAFATDRAAGASDALTTLTI